MTQSLLIKTREGRTIQSWPWKPGQRVNEEVRQECLAAVTHKGCVIVECTYEEAMTAVRGVKAEELECVTTALRDRCACGVIAEAGSLFDE